MIFEVYLDDKILYFPNDETYEIVNSKLELALNEAGSFEFDIPSSNLRYDDFKLRQSMIRIMQNDVEIFYGEVREVTQNFNFTKHVYAVGELAFLFDSIQPQKNYQMTPVQVFESFINEHNAQVEARKKFELGFVQVTDPNNYIYRFTNREDTLTAMRDKLCDSLGGYLRIRKANGVRYLDLVPLINYGTYCKQEIQFGENLIDYSCNMTASDIATCCIPLGKRLEDTERTSAAVDGLDEFLTIVGEPVDTEHKNINDDFVVLDGAVKNYGYVRVVKNWDNVTTKSELKKNAVEWLKSAQYETMILELNALDLNLLDANIDSFDVGDTIHAWALPFGMDTTFPVQKKTIYLNDLSKNSVVLGSSYQKSYTSQASGAVEALARDIPEVSPILISAKLNALKMLSGSEGGHVVMKFDPTNSYIEELIICDAPTEEKSLRKWVWNINGLGYMTRKDINDPWTDLGVAMTMRGEVVADFITVGTLQGITLTGNTINGNTINGGTINGTVVNSSLFSGSKIQSPNGVNYISLEDNGGGVVRLGNGALALDNQSGYYKLELVNGRLNILQNAQIVCDGMITARNIQLYVGGKLNDVSQLLADLSKATLGQESRINALESRPTPSGLNGWYVTGESRTMPGYAYYVKFQNGCAVSTHYGNSKPI